MKMKTKRYMSTYLAMLVVGAFLCAFGVKAGADIVELTGGGIVHGIIDESRSNEDYLFLLTPQSIQGISIPRSRVVETEKEPPEITYARMGDELFKINAYTQALVYYRKALEATGDEKGQSEIRRKIDLVVSEIEKKNMEQERDRIESISFQVEEARD